VEGSLPVTEKRFQTGFTLIEVLVTFLLIATGLLGLAALQVTTINNAFEAQQRALVTALVDDMAERLRMNPVGVRSENYQSFDPQIPCPTSGVTADGQATMSPEVRAALDECQWAAMLKGLAVKTAEADTSGIGAPIGAMGCLDAQIRPGDETVVRVAVAWQGLTAQVAPFATCGTGQFTNTDSVAPTVDEAFRRVVYRDVVVR
jgi:type IV pilus assembly protein PilV